MQIILPSSSFREESRLSERGGSRIELKDVEWICLSSWCLYLLTLTQCTYLLSLNHLSSQPPRSKSQNLSKILSNCQASSHPSTLHFNPNSSPLALIKPSKLLPFLGQTKSCLLPPESLINTISSRRRR